MTTFEITIIILAVLGVMMMGWLVKVGKNVFEALQVANIQIRDIKSHTNYLINLGYHLPKLVDISNQMQNAWACDVTSIVKRINELTDIVDKMHRNLCVEIADKMVDRVYPPTYVTPCYAPDGICTNPQMDCINCPKRGTGGTWSTNISIKAEDAPLQ